MPRIRPRADRALQLRLTSGLRARLEDACRRLHWPPSRFMQRLIEQQITGRRLLPALEPSPRARADRQRPLERLVMLISSDAYAHLAALGYQYGGLSRAAVAKIMLCEYFSIRPLHDRKSESIPVSRLSRD